jgi:indolepyruvate ferredoxin oxidoreductase beta subunit
MKIDIILAGVGGQGILSIAATIGLAAVEAGLYLKQTEVHGMSQRGGDVQSNLRLSDKEIHSDLIPYGEADMIIAVEPMESLRHLPMLSKKGWIITNTTAFVNIPNYPDKEALMDEIGKIPNHIALDADTIAKDVGASKSANMVVLGAASPFINIDYSLLENGIRRLFISKGEDVVNFNLAAMKAGRNITEEKLKDSR